LRILEAWIAVIGCQSNYCLVLALQSWVDAGIRVLQMATLTCSPRDVAALDDGRLADKSPFDASRMRDRPQLDALVALWRRLSRQEAAMAEGNTTRKDQTGPDTSK
jgi:hypothetical protein